MSSRYLAALSLSSFDSNDQFNATISDAYSTGTHAEMCQQLCFMDEIASNFYLKRPIILKCNRASFAEIESGTEQQFEIHIGNWSDDDVVVISISCIPNCALIEDNFSREKRKIISDDFNPLSFTLTRLDSSHSLTIKPALFNGEYCLTLSKAHGVLTGTYLLAVAISVSKDTNRHVALDTTQTVRVLLETHRAVRAIPVECNKSVYGEVDANHFDFYRFVLADHSKVLNIRVSPLKGSDTHHSIDSDIFVSNRYEGLVAASKDSFVWRSTETGDNMLDIYPDDLHLDDTHTHTGAVFMIGVTSSNEGSLCYELVVTVSNALPSVSLPLQSSNSTLTTTPWRKVIDGKLPIGSPSTNAATSEHYSYYSLPINPSLRDMVAIVAQTGGSSLAHTAAAATSTLGQIKQTQLISMKSGRGVYVSEFVCDSSVGDCHLITLYISTKTRYPTADNYMWKACSLRSSAESTSAAFILDFDEWKYLADVCYFSVAITRHQQSDHVSDDSQTSSPYELSINYFPELSLSTAIHRDDDACVRSRYELYYHLFNRVDGSLLSQTDRSTTTAVNSSHNKLMYPPSHIMSNASSQSMSVMYGSSSHTAAVDELSLVYSEVDYLSFVELLTLGGAKDGQIFYDLGCGAGRAVVAAALSGIRFVKCVGIEVLPALSEGASMIVNTLHQHYISVDTNKSSSSVTLPTENRVAAKISNKDNSNDSAKIKKNIMDMKISLPLLEIRNANILDTDWSEADCVFVSSLCFSDRLVQAIVDKAEGLKIGSRLLTLKLPTHYETLFVLDSQNTVKMAWGRATLFVLIRVAAAADVSPQQ